MRQVLFFSLIGITVGIAIHPVKLLCIYRYDY
jgi:hypothetical protein